MNKNKFGFNIQFADTADRDLCLARMGTYRPEWCLTYSVSDAAALHNVGVHNVAVRLYPDGGVNERKSLEDIILKYEKVASAGFWIELTNEFVSVSWLKSVLRPLLELGWKVCAPAFSSGTPEPADWEQFKFMFECYRDFPSTFRFSVHEYMPSSPYNQKLYPYVILQKPITTPWRPGESTNEKVLNWYNGRFEQFAFAWADKWGLPRPRYIITEAGIANQRNDTNTFQPSGGWTNGWRSREGWLTSIVPGKSGAATYCDLNTWIVDNLSEYCEGYILFNYADDRNNIPKNSQNDWKPFCVANDLDFWLEYDKWYKGNDMSVEVVLPEYWIGMMAHAKDERDLTYIRVDADRSSKIIGSFNPEVFVPVEIDWFGWKVNLNEGRVWVRVRQGTLVGFSAYEFMVFAPASESTDSEKAAATALGEIIVSLNSAYANLRITMGDK